MTLGCALRTAWIPKAPTRRPGDPTTGDLNDQQRQSQNL